ncbi:MAG: hypothetical protein ACXWV0_01520 [Flavisolibacter sp.]
MENNKKFTRQFLLAYYVIVMAKRNFLIITMFLLLIAVASVLQDTALIGTYTGLPARQGSSVNPFFPSILFN